MQFIDKASDTYKRRLIKEIRTVLESGNGVYYCGTRLSAVYFINSSFDIKTIHGSVVKGITDLDCFYDGNGRHVVASTYR